MTSYTTNVFLAGVAALLLSGCTAVSTSGTGATLTTTSSGATLGSSTTTTTTTSGFSSSAGGFSSAATGFGSGFAQNASVQNASFQQSASMQGMDASAFPPNPLPGECYARIALAAVTQTVEEQIMIEPARQEVRIIPAQFGDVTEEVVVREATTELLTVPATYTTVQEEVVVRPAARRLIPVEPIYDTVIEEIVVVPERTVWKPGTGPIQKLDEATGEILCLVTEPAVTKQVERRVMIQPASTREEIIPAVTEVVEREVVNTPARVEERLIPAETRTVTRRVEVVPAREEIIEIPPVFDTIAREVVIEPARTEWRSILCETNTTPDIIRRIQVSLQQRGYYNGPIDGIFGPLSQRAIDGFQRDNGQVGSGVTIDTLSLLGVSAF
ncbi:MAG: peptidoglycan-binding protein [Alphaproteobacteria bacterium]|nr:peptidoglycan-binding protein [Alphaproteobacteria bacterium]